MVIVIVIVIVMVIVIVIVIVIVGTSWAEYPFSRCRIIA